jgi:hypothetical protein
MLGWIDFLACRGHDHDRLGFDPGLGFHWFLTLLESAVETRVSKGRDVPGQSGTGRPVVSLSRDKKDSLSRCPFVPGQEQQQKSRDKILCPGSILQKKEKKMKKNEKFF